jgi:hypothetical protein
MTLPWYLTAIGLYLCTAAAWFMYRYPMSATMLAAGGAGEPMLSNPTAEGQGAFKRYQRCSVWVSFCSFWAPFCPPSGAAPTDDRATGEMHHRCDTHVETPPVVYSPTSQRVRPRLPLRLASGSEAGSLNGGVVLTRMEARPLSM